MPESEYQKLAKDAEVAADIADVMRINERLATGEEELIPAEVVNRILDGESKVKVWREYRNLGLRELAAKVDISPAYLSQIEGGTRDGTFESRCYPILTSCSLRNAWGGTSRLRGAGPFRTRPDAS